MFIEQSQTVIENSPISVAVFLTPLVGPSDFWFNFVQICSPNNIIMQSVANYIINFRKATLELSVIKVPHELGVSRQVGIDP